MREDGPIWMVMDLLTGHTGAQINAHFPRLPLPWVLKIGRAATEGLSAVHAYAVHRDIKPKNLHLGDDAVVRVLDLGAGKFHRSGLLTTNGGTLGTAPYMSPEQMSPTVPLDGRSDIFSLAVVLTELVSGVHPFAPGGMENENMFTIVSKIVNGPPLVLRSFAPRVPAHVAEVIDRALSRSPQQRQGSAAELGAALGVALDRLEREVGAGAPLEALVAELVVREGDREARVTNPFGATAPAIPGGDEQTPKRPA